MTTLLDRPPAVAPTPVPRAASRHWRGIVLFFGLTGLYFAIGYLLVMRYNLFDLDGVSRVANAGYVIQSRHPHLSAIGFVWNPLPSLVEIPVLLLDRWWPELRTHGLAGVVQSALFMAGAALMVRRIALDRGVGSGWRRVAVAAFALQPMIIVYGASGMSEAAETFCMLWCARYLMRWSDGRNPVDLALAGLALGVGFTARYEVAPAALGVAVFVAVMTGRRAAAGSRRSTVLAHVAIVLLPIAVSASLWALTGWVVNHELFATFSSQYGNESQVKSAMQRGGPLARAASADWVVIAARMLGMKPFVGIAAAGAVIYAAFMRKPTTLVPIVTFGPILAFAAWGQYTSTTFGWFRFYLLAIPLVVCVALACWTPTATARRPSRSETSARKFAAGLLCASLLVGFPVTVVASLNQRIGNQQLQFGFNSLLHPQRFAVQDLWYRQLMFNDRVMADHLDRQSLADGTVLMDTFNTWGVWLSSTHPQQFVITSDYDFTAALNRPWAFDIKYLLLSNPAASDADAINLRYPSLWNDGAGFSRLVYSVSGPNDEDQFRLFEITGAPRNVLSPPP
jgi:hypothetical protein